MLDIEDKHLVRQFTFDWNTQFSQENDCRFYITPYNAGADGGSPAWFVYNAVGECVMHVSRNFHLPKEQIAVKDYSENAGALSELQRLGIVGKDALRIIQSGWVDIPVFELTEFGKSLLASVW